MFSAQDDAPDRPLISADVDEAVGTRLKFRRQVLGWSQDELARLCNVSAQQIHKYEKGLSAIRPHRLLKLSEALGVPVKWFFVGLELNSAMPSDIVEVLANPEIAQLVREFQEIEDADVRSGFLKLIRSYQQNCGSTT
ncbi:MAG: helix-turn-helix domain-containing protein [Hyphomicrobiaceae bacterium]